jgi:hypothetical protein
MKYNKLVKTLAIAMASIGLISNASAQEDRSYILATASTGGTYYPVGVALATLSKVKLAPKQHFSLAAISSAGSGENVKLLNENEAQFAILQGLYGAWAWQGLGPYEKSGQQTQLRSVSMLWQNVEHFIVRSDLAKTGTVSDLENLSGKNSLSVKKTQVLKTQDAKSCKACRLTQNNLNSPLWATAAVPAHYKMAPSMV